MRLGPLPIAVSALLCACSAPTQLLVEVRPEPGLPSTMGLVVDVFEDESGDRVDGPVTLAVSEAAWVRSFAVVPRGGDATRRAHVVLTGCASRPADGEACPIADVVASQQFRTGFVAGRKIRVPIELAPACTGVDCPFGRFCAANGGITSCAPIDGASDADAGTPTTLSTKYLVSPIASMSCALGAVQFWLGEMTFQRSASGLEVDGTPCAMRGPLPDAAGGFHVSCTIDGDCAETYMLDGTIAGDGTWHGMFLATFDPRTAPDACTVLGDTCAPMQWALSGRAIACACPDRDLGGVTGYQVAYGWTTGMCDAITLPCGASGAEDVNFLWRAITPGRYRFTTCGSHFDAILGVSRGTCGGASVCSSTSGGAGVDLDVLGGDLVYITLEGLNATNGQYALNVLGPIADASCWDQDLGSAVGPAVAMDTTVGRVNRFAGNCGGQNAPERAYRWTAPRAGTYVFDTIGSTLDTVLYFVPEVCAGCPMECSDDIDMTMPQSRLMVSLAEGETRVIVVDGFSASAGAFTLNITAL